MPHGSPGVPRPSRKKSTRHPLLQGRSQRVWHEELAGVVPHYPITLEAFEALQRNGREVMKKVNARPDFHGRRGVPDGWAARREERAAIMAKAENEAAGIVKVLVASGTIDADAGANEVLQTAIALVRAGDAVTVRDRIAAARLFLDFTRSKPESSSKVRLEKAEDFLSRLAVEATSQGRD